MRKIKNQLQNIWKVKLLTAILQTKIYSLEKMVSSHLLIMAGIISDNKIKLAEAAATSIG